MEINDYRLYIWLSTIIFSTRQSIEALLNVFDSATHRYQKDIKSNNLRFCQYYFFPQISEVLFILTCHTSGKYTVYKQMKCVIFHIDNKLFLLIFFLRI